jgi:hypothetical protein
MLNLSQRSVLGRLRRIQTVFAVAVMFACCGCAHLATVKVTRAPLPAATGNDEQLQAAKQCLVSAEREQSLRSLGKNLSAAKLSLQVLERRPNDSLAQSVYNFSVARAVENVERAKIQPWRNKIDVVNDGSNYTLTTPKPIDSQHDPSRYDLFPTDSLKISGQFFKTRSSVSGVGAPLVAVARSENPQSRQQYRLPRVYAPVTAAIRFSGQKAELEFVDPMKSDRIALTNALSR